MRSRIAFAIKQIGGVDEAAKLTGVSSRAVYKWLKSGRLPRTAYTGEKNYAQMLSQHPQAEFSASWLLDQGSDNTKSCAA